MHVPNTLSILAKLVQAVQHSVWVPALKCQTQVMFAACSQQLKAEDTSNYPVLTSH